MGNQHNISYKKNKHNLPINLSLNNEIEKIIKKRVNLTPNKEKKINLSSNDCISTNSALTNYRTKNIKKKYTRQKISHKNIINVITQIYNNNIFNHLNQLTELSLFKNVFNYQIRLKNNKRNDNKFIDFDTSPSIFIPFDIFPISENNIPESLFMSPEEINDFNNICTNYNIKNKEYKPRNTQKNLQNIHLDTIDNNEKNYLNTIGKFNISNNNTLSIEENLNIKEIKNYEPNDSNKTYIEIIEALNNEKTKVNNKNNIKKDPSSNSSDKKISKVDLYKKKPCLPSKKKIVNPFNFNLAMDNKKIIYKKKSNLNNSPSSTLYSDLKIAQKKVHGKKKNI
jgi:hypothetical protein